MVVEWIYLNKSKKEIRKEMFSNMSKVEYLMTLMQEDKTMQSYIPKDAEYVLIKQDKEEELYWIDRRETIIDFKPWD